MHLIFIAAYKIGTNMRDEVSPSRTYRGLAFELLNVCATRSTRRTERVTTGAGHDGGQRQPVARGMAHASTRLATSSAPLAAAHTPPG